MPGVAPADDWGVPRLLADRQGEIALPVVTWGSCKRGTYNPGTWAFYTDDYRFRALLSDPGPLLRSGCVSVVEPNFTLFDQTARAECLWTTYRKRTFSRACQEAGLGILVDLNFPHRAADVCMRGVPVGWSAFATRGYSERLDDLRAELSFARVWSRDRATVLVYGGGRQVQDFCAGQPDVVWVADQRSVAREKVCPKD